MMIKGLERSEDKRSFNKNYIIMNDIQLYNYYLSLPKDTPNFRGKIYPKYCVITGYSITHPHRHYSFEEFIDKLDKDKSFRDFLIK